MSSIVGCINELHLFRGRREDIWGLWRSSWIEKQLGDWQTSDRRHCQTLGTSPSMRNLGQGVTKGERASQVTSQFFLFLIHSIQSDSKPYCSYFGNIVCISSLLFILLLAGSRMICLKHTTNLRSYNLALLLFIGYTIITLYNLDGIFSF